MFKKSESNLFIKKWNDWENKNAFHVYIYQTMSQKTDSTQTQTENQAEAGATFLNSNLETLRSAR